jgi:hypothetical protein
LIFVAVSLALSGLVGGTAFFAGYDPSQLIKSRATVTPAEGRNIVYVDNSQPQIRCTATTTSGETLTLPPFSGAQRRKVLGARGQGTPFWAVAELPLDRGALAVSCPPVTGLLWISAPSDYTGLFIYLGTIVGLSITLVVVNVVIRRRRSARRGRR